MQTARIHTVFAILVMAGALACSDSSTDTSGEDQCVIVSGNGQTVGTTQTLMGTGDFKFDGLNRPADVGLYLFDLVDLDDTRKRARLVYQFLWENGDSFVTNDPDVIMSRSLQGDQFVFKVSMTITIGTGAYKSMAGQRPFSLDGEITFGPPAEPNGPATASEEFQMGGRLCEI